MADWADHAREREEADREAALSAFRNRNRPEVESARACRDCGEPIPEARRRAVPGTLYCTFCAGQRANQREHR